MFLDNIRDEEKNRPNRELTLMIMDKLNTFGAINIKDSMIWGNPNSDKKNNDKLRFTFIIEDRDQALLCYKFFTKYSKN